MKIWFNALRPAEKRLVVVVGLVFFVVFNFWFVFPYFSERDALTRRIDKARIKLNEYDKTIQQANHKLLEIRRMEGDGGAVPAEDQAMHLQTAVQTMASQAGIIPQVGRITQRTNQFFLELSMPVMVNTRVEPLIGFLYNLGAGSSLIRVRELAVRPDAPRQSLSANIKLVASFQKKMPVRAGAGTTAPGGAAAGSASSPSTSSKKS